MFSGIKAGKCVSFTNASDNLADVIDTLADATDALADVIDALADATDNTCERFRLFYTPAYIKLTFRF